MSLDNGQNLPDGWQWVTLENICRDISDGTHFTPTYIDDGIPFLSVKNIRESGINFDDCRFISKEEHQQLCKRCKPEKGDVLYTKVGTTGIAKAIDLEKEFSIFVSVALLKLNSEVIPEFLEKVLNSPICKIQAEKLTQGAANRNLVIKDLKKITLPLPPLPEQKRIAAILNEQIEAVQKARQATEAQLQAAKKLPAAYLREVFESDAAKSWERKKLEDVCELQGGMQPPKSAFRYEPQPGYIRLVQIQDFRRSDMAVYIPKEEAKRTFDKSDVMIGRYGPPVFQILRGLSGAYNVAMIKAIPRKGLLKDYLYYLLQEPEIQKAVNEQSQRSAGQSGVQKSFLEKYFVSIPSLDKQQEIAFTLTEQMQEVERLKQSLQEQLDTINKLPAALLRRAFNGEL